MIDPSSMRAFATVKQWPDRGALPRVLPFALFIAFVALEEGARTAALRQWFVLPEPVLYALYPVKACSVAALLWLWRGSYPELHLRDLLDLKRSTLAVVIGLITFLVWINLQVTLPLVGGAAGFDPTLLPEGAPRLVLTAARVAGAVLVVPVMEELFWRSFLLRYLIHPDFESVPLGSFSWSSFLVASALFALEHHFFLAGLAAGAIYNLLLYRTRSLVLCVMAHAVTNLVLAMYVLHSGKWYFW
ncbi:CAAX prenyl protease-related protein [Geomonas diazotrophica]|uniref:CAAX prenyl protease-related protein n=1 Tax=Geomonas diazotrophica TaxID=2843197 RepID=UPI001EF2ED3B|nr:MULTISPECIES: CAAX prenyl protease-related protein [Geomonas]